MSFFRRKLTKSRTFSTPVSNFMTFQVLININSKFRIYQMLWEPYNRTRFFRPIFQPRMNTDFSKVLNYYIKLMHDLLWHQRLNIGTPSWTNHSVSVNMHLQYKTSTPVMTWTVTYIQWTIKTVASRVKKKELQFSDKHCKLPTEDGVGLQPRFLHFWMKIFWHKDFWTTFQQTLN